MRAPRTRSIDALESDIVKRLGKCWRSSVVAQAPDGFVLIPMNDVMAAINEIERLRTVTDADIQRVIAKVAVTDADVERVAKALEPYLHDHISRTARLDAARAALMAFVGKETTNG